MVVWGKGFGSPGESIAFKQPMADPMADRFVLPGPAGPPTTGAVAWLLELFPGPRSPPKQILLGTQIHPQPSRFLDSSYRGPQKISLLSHAQQIQSLEQPSLSSAHGILLTPNNIAKASALHGAGHLCSLLGIKKKTVCGGLGEGFWESGGVYIALKQPMADPMADRFVLPGPAGPPTTGTVHGSPNCVLGPEASQKRFFWAPRSTHNHPGS